jgi:hypothetical protein
MNRRLIAITLGVALVLVMAITSGGVTKKATLMVQPAVLSSIACDPTNFTGGNPVTCTVKLGSPAPSGGVNINLSSSNSLLLTFHFGLAKKGTFIIATIAAGQSNATFTLTTKPVATQTSVTISASYGGVTKTAALTIQPRIVTLQLIVRTVNVFQAGGPPNYEPLYKRLLGIAQAFHANSPDQIGLIGMQEAGFPPLYNAVEVLRKKCDQLHDEGTEGWVQCNARADQVLADWNQLYGAGTNHMSAAEFLATQLTKLYQSSPAAWGWQTGTENWDTNVGIVVGGEWKIVGSPTHWKLKGVHDYCEGVRQMVEVRLEHRTKGYRLRFYDVHLSSGNGGANPLNPCEPSASTRREYQVKDIVEKVRGRAEPGELPPIVVGDFNAGRSYSTCGVTERSVTLMEANFWRPLDSLYNRSPGEASVEAALQRLCALLDIKKAIEQVRQKCYRNNPGATEQCDTTAKQKLEDWRQNHSAEVDSLRQRLGPDTGIDQVYIGKKNSFPQSARSFLVLEQHRVPLKAPGLSDHFYSEGFRLGVWEPALTAVRVSH